MIAVPDKPAANADRGVLVWRTLELSVRIPCISARRRSMLLSTSLAVTCDCTASLASFREAVLVDEAPSDEEGWWLLR